MVLSLPFRAHDVAVSVVGFLDLRLPCSMTTKKQCSSGAYAIFQSPMHGVSAAMPSFMPFMLSAGLGIEKGGCLAFCCTADIIDALI